MEIREKIARLTEDRFRYPAEKAGLTWDNNFNYMLASDILVLFNQWLEEQGAVKALPIKGDYIFPEIHTEYEPLRIK